MAVSNRCWAGGEVRGWSAASESPGL